MRADGSSWAIATPHAAASDAGARALATGGNALDAALAAATTLAVVYPHMCGVGGDLFALVQRDDGTAMAINSSGRAPAGADPDALRALAPSMPPNGPATVTVPGAVEGWSILHGLGARLPWRDAFGPAIACASDGMPVAPSLAEGLAWHAGKLAADPGLTDVFAPGSTRMGDTLRQPALAATLERIAEGGRDAFYGGEVGRRYASGLRELGVPIAENDMAEHRSDVLPPLAARYRDLHVSVAPPNSQGFTLLEILSVVERLGIDPDPDGPDAGRIALIARAAGADRDLHLADADAMTVHPHTLLDDGHLAAVADQIRDRTVAGTHRARATGDTVALMSADADGNAVSLIQSLFHGFGSGLLEPATGIVAQSRGAGFTLDPGHVNELAPGKRPAHTLLPVLVHRAGVLAAAAGTMGGYGQPQIDATTLIRAFDLDMHPADAVAAPRWLAFGMDTEGEDPWVAAVEDGVSPGARRSLAAAGFRLDEAAGSALGHAHMIRVRAGRLEAGSDPRSDGAAIAL